MVRQTSQIPNSEFQILNSEFRNFEFRISKKVMDENFGAGDTGGIAGLKCRNLTSDVSRQCRGCAGVLISR